MTSTSLDAIVRDFLLRRRYPLHYYLECLVAAKNCLRTISLDDLYIVNTKKLPVNSYNAVDLPDDFLDYTRVGIQVGQYVKPLVESRSINNLNNRNASYAPIKYNENAGDPNTQTFFGYLYPFYYNMVTWNEYGENTGRLFGFGAGADDDTFKIIKERNQIQLTENLSADFLILEYISDGMDADNATRITPYAFETISAYIMWQLAENNRTYGIGEKERYKQAYIDERKILRARLSPLTLENFKRIIQKASYASPKSE